jgi:hypothetical protein
VIEVATDKGMGARCPAMTNRPTRIDYEGLMECARGEMFGPG